MAAPQKRSLIPFLLLLLLALSTLFLFTLHPTPPTVSTQPRHLHRPPSNFTLIIKLLTYNRLASLKRCLSSLSAAHYDGLTPVHLHVFVDHLQHPATTAPNLTESHRILEFVDGFAWNHGDKLVHYRTSNAGLQAQWLEAWWPSSDHEFAFVVEDDLEVSPFYFVFLKSVILNYYYNSSNFSPMIYGASLQRPRFVPGKHGNKLILESETRLFLYQLVGTWGQLLFPRPWKEFRLWYDEHKADGLKPFLDGMVTTGWYKKLGEKIWTPWFIKFIHARGYFNIYTNFLHERALSVSHRDAGVNYGKTAGPDSYLLDENTFDPKLLEMQPLSSLKWYDFCFRVVSPNRVVRNLEQLQSVLHSVQKDNSIVILSLYQTSEIVTRNLLCLLERYNIRNYIFLGPKSDFLLDLARRGHPVINADMLFDSIGLAKSFKFQEPRDELIKGMVVKAYIIKQSLEQRYNVWVLENNIVPVSSDTFLDSFEHTNDIYVGKHLKLLFFRSSTSTWKTWVDNFIHRMSTNVDSLRTKDSSYIDGSFVVAVKKSLEEKNLKFSVVDEMEVGLDTDLIIANQTSLRNGDKYAFWSSTNGIDFVQKQLLQLGLWVIDSDSSCTAVVCHPS